MATPYPLLFKKAEASIEQAAYCKFIDYFHTAATTFFFSSKSTRAKMTAIKTETEPEMTSQVDNSTKFNLGLPSEHKPLSVADQNEVTGTEKYAPVLYANYLPVWETPQAK